MLKIWPSMPINISTFITPYNNHNAVQKMNLIKSRILIILILACSFVGFFACNDETTTIGSGIASGEVEISIDTFSFNLDANPIYQENYDSKTGNLMLGNIYHPTYGTLECSFISRLMCATDLLIPDSLLMPERVDSCKLIFAAEREDIIGDSLAPQKLSVFKMNKFPTEINNTFDPEGYFDPSQGLLGSLNYTVSNISTKDSMFLQGKYVELNVDLPKSFGAQIFEKYKNEPGIFQWPDLMAKDFIPGIYVKSSFGNGCIANISEGFLAVFYYSLQETTTVENGDTIKTLQHVRYSALPFSISPEVVSSNNISYNPSQKIIEFNQSHKEGQCVITTPGGYVATFDFPIETILNRYNEKDIHLSTVGDLLLYIPAQPFDEESGISLAQNLLLIKKSEYQEFFEKNKVPDNKMSFTGQYDSSNSRYVFSSMREYFLDMLEKKDISYEDTEFILIPVELKTETVSNSYYGTSTTYITKCSPYTVKPTMTLVDTGNATVTFSFTTQIID